jgi:hypothetical protein
MRSNDHKWQPPRFPVDNSVGTHISAVVAHGSAPLATELHSKTYHGPQIGRTLKIPPNSIGVKITLEVLLFRLPKRTHGDAVG